METTTITNAAAIENAAQNVNQAYTGHLINGFKKRFPNEVSKVHISKETLMQAIGNSAEVSGLRFMYGFQSINKNGIKVLSRTILLMPCGSSPEDDGIGRILLKEEYLTHSGKSVGFEKAKQLMYNHAIRFASYFPEEKFNKIMRGCYADINTVSLLLNIEGCAGINFHFGYDETIADAPLRNKPVIEVVDSSGTSVDTLHSDMPCPPWCGTVNPCPPWCNPLDLFAKAHN